MPQRAASPSTRRTAFTAAALHASPTARSATKIKLTLKVQPVTGGQAFSADLLPKAAPGVDRQYAIDPALAGFKVPAFWHSAGSLPHSAAGKLLRRELASWHAEQCSQ
jgi:acyl-CoA synthetase (AMP-forming)/AMP-acid ligase II